MNPQERLIVALDFPSAAQALQMVERLEGSVRWVKVGLELYLAEGRKIIDALCARDLKVFLDLKLHDIPNTVAAAVRVSGESGASLLTIHAGGGPAMIAAAAGSAPTSLQLLAVTVLTSMDAAQLAATGITASPAQHAVLLGEMAIAAGAHGLVCSAEEIIMLRSSTAQHAQLVVPGVRPLQYQADDQRRVASATEAILRGADKLVVGRPITRATDPAAAAAALLDEIAAGQPG